MKQDINITIPKGTIISGIKDLGENDIVLKNDLNFTIKEKTVYEVNNDVFEIHNSCYSIKDLKDEILHDLKFNYYFYGEEKDEELTKNAIELKNTMLKLFDKQD